MFIYIALLDGNLRLVQFCNQDSYMQSRHVLECCTHAFDINNAELLSDYGNQATFAVYLISGCIAGAELLEEQELCYFQVLRLYASELLSDSGNPAA
jgi:hypothetical protein